jgi:hypothetical protein
MEGHEDNPEISAPTQAGAEESLDVVQAATSSVTDVTPLLFIDHTGRKFLFPYESCKTYAVGATFLILPMRRFAKTSGYSR